MKRWLLAAILLLVTAFLTGMGSLGGAPEGGVPQTEENIKVRLTDRQGVATELTQFSVEGKTAIEGKYGSALMTVFFRNIQRAEFGPGEGEEVPVRLFLKTGETLEIKVRKRHIFYGSTGFGALQIRAREIARIELL